MMETVISRWRVSLAVVFRTRFKFCNAFRAKSLRCVTILFKNFKMEMASVQEVARIFNISLVRK